MSYTTLSEDAKQLIHYIATRYSNQGYVLITKQRTASRLNINHHKMPKLIDELIQNRLIYPPIKTSSTEWDVKITTGGWKQLNLEPKYAAAPAAYDSRLNANDYYKNRHRYAKRAKR